MEYPQSQTRQQFPLSEKKIMKKTLAGSIGSIVALLFIMLFFIPIAGELAVLIPETTNINIYPIIFICLAALVFLAIIGQYIYQTLYFKAYYYDLTENFIIIKKGVITSREITIPYERVQDVYVDQDIFDRLFGLYDVHLSSATYSSGFEAHIDGVKKPAADGLKNVLLTTIHNKNISMQTQAPMNPVNPTVAL